MPYAEKVLDSLKKRQAELQGGNLNLQGLADTQGLVQQASQESNPNAMNMVNQYLGQQN